VFCLKTNSKTSRLGLLFAKTFKTNLAILEANFFHPIISSCRNSRTSRILTFAHDFPQANQVPAECYRRLSSSIICLVNTEWLKSEPLWPIFHEPTLCCGDLDIFALIVFPCECLANISWLKYFLEEKERKR